MITDFGDGRLWRKATRSGDNGGTCVYIARDEATGMIGIRDSKEGVTGIPKWYTRQEWDAFLHGVKAGEFDDI
ncbi:MAG: DUF397 domain-containing protein [Corynebacteriales bacterium]|nr:DUF397 domain-containing protein [Mycobacteriales bacterium]